MLSPDIILWNTLIILKNLNNKQLILNFKYFIDIKDKIKLVITRKKNLKIL